MRRPLLIITLSLHLLLVNCSLPRDIATPAPDISITPTDMAPPPLPTPELGLAENPLILALNSSTNTPEQINAAKALAGQLSERTGFAVVVVTSDSNMSLTGALEIGNAHIVLLDPLSYEVAYQKGLVKAVFAVVKDGKAMYGSQFIASQKSGFKSYFDQATQTNTAEASVALSQFADKKPCWTDETSPSGYFIPLGFLNTHQILTQPAAFVQGHPTVVRSIYAGGICDFGATYIDARKFPSLEDQYPDLMEQVVVIWQIPEIIPHAVLAFSSQMPESMRESFASTLQAILQTDDGKETFKTTFDIEEFLAVNDATFEEFHEYTKESRLNLSDFLK